MTISVFDRRRAERFAELLDEAGPRHHARSRFDEDLSALVALSQRTTTVKLKPATGPDPAFRAELRARLVATAEREGIGVTAASTTGEDRPGTRLITAGRARAAIVVGVAAGAVALSGMSVASGDAMPGDPLYRVKRSTERAQLAFTGSDVTRGQLYLEFARTRLAEAKAVTGDAASFTRVLGDMDSDTRQGVKLLTTAAADRHDPAALDAVDAFVTDQRGDVGGVLDQVGGGSRGRLLDSLGLLSQVTKRSQLLRETLTCGVSASEGSDALGPRPRSCSPAGSSANGTGPTEQSPADRGTNRGTRPGNADPTATPDGPGSSPTGITATNPPDVTGETGQPTQSQTPTPAASGDGGLLGGLSRIVGDLLG